MDGVDIINITIKNAFKVLLPFILNHKYVMIENTVKPNIAKTLNIAASPILSIRLFPNKIK